MVLQRLCCSVVLTFIIALTSAWKTEQKSGILKYDYLMILCGKLSVVVKKPVPTPLSVGELSVLSENSLMRVSRSFL